MDEVRQALRLCPQEVAQRVLTLPAAERIEELRFRIGREVTYLRAGSERALGIRVNDEMVRWIMDRATAQSIYAAQEMLRQGFLTVAGGHRLGLCGTGVYKQEELTTLKDIRSLCLRIARRVPGAAAEAADILWRAPESTLILGPPGRGKTTLLRELVRHVSDCFRWRICVVDERMELAGTSDCTAQFDLGQFTDVLSGVRKRQGIEMLTRAMNPQWIAVDEITAEEDVDAITRASYCGVRFLATAHGDDLSDLKARPVYRKLQESGVFQNLLILRPDRAIRKERLHA